jgi:putative transposase
MILIFKLNSRLAIENLALRQQLAVMKKSIRRPKIRRRDRLFWVILSRLWFGWENALILVQPGTVIRWHRKGFKLYWKFKSQKPGRPSADIKIQRIVKKMIKENPLWGAPVMHGLLNK